MNDSPTLLRAAWVAPMDGPPVRDAAVLIDGSLIRDVGDARTLAARHPSATIEDLGDSLLTPGLVNAHAHLELSHLTPGEPPATFADWLIRLTKQLQTDTSDGPRAATRAILAGVEQSLRFGVTTIGDITSQPHLTRPLLRKSALRVVSFGEVRAMAGRRQLLDARLDAAADKSAATDRLSMGVSPHAPYSVETDGYRQCLARAARDGLPITTHLAETPDEAAFLRDHSGPLRRVWDFLGGWDEKVPTFDGGPIRFAQTIGLLDVPGLLAHVNYCDDQELDILAASQASVVYCPRTHAYFGHGPHRWREMLERDINVAIGTDSCASSPDLNLLDDMRLLRSLAPEVPPQTIWEMGTRRGAEALGLRDRIGTITPGKAADLIAIKVSGDDPLANILDGKESPAKVWIDGRRTRYE